MNEFLSHKTKDHRELPLRISTPVTRRYAFKRIGGIIVAAPTLVTLIPSNASAVELNNCKPGTTYHGDLGQSLISYCDRENGEFTLAFKEGFADLIKLKTEQSENESVGYLSDITTDSKINFQAIFTAIYNQKGGETPFHLRWSTGSMEEEMGYFITGGISAQTLAQMNFVHMRWEKRIMHQIAAFDKEGQEVLVEQQYVPTRKPRPRREYIDPSFA